MRSTTHSFRLFCLFLMMITICARPIDVLAGNEADISCSRQATADRHQDSRINDILKEKTDNILRFAVHVSQAGKLDPHFAAASQDRTIADMVFNGLLRYKPGNAPAIEPDLAEAMPVLTTHNGRQIWTVKLRRGIMFHPGPITAAYELTADDVVYSFLKASDPRRSAYAGDYDGITVKKAGRHTVKFILDNPMSSILFFPRIANYNGGFIVSKKAIEKMGYDKYITHPVGTGPFMFKHHEPGVRLNLAANPAYFRGKPLLDGVALYFVPDIEKRWSGLVKGQFDVVIVNGQKGFENKRLETPGIEINTHGPGEVATIYFNTHIPPMDDIRVRSAITWAIDRNDYLNIYDKNIAGPVYSPVPVDFLPGGLTRSEIKQLGLADKTDLDKARALLREAGYPTGFKLHLLGSEKRIYTRLYNILKTQLAKINIDCTIDIRSHSEMHRAIRNTPQPIVIYMAWRPNADVFLTRFFHSNSVLITGKKPDTNFSHYNSIDKLIEAARFEINPDKQISLWQQAQIRILNDKVAYPVMYAIMSTPKNSYVDYGHSLNNAMALYPQFTEKTRILNRQ